MDISSHFIPDPAVEIPPAGAAHAVTEAGKLLTAYQASEGMEGDDAETVAAYFVANVLTLAWALGLDRAEIASRALGYSDADLGR